MLLYVQINVHESYRKRTRVRLFLLNCDKKYFACSPSFGGREAGLPAGIKPEEPPLHDTHHNTPGAANLCFTSRCFLRSESSHVSSVEMRVEEAGRPQLTYLSSSPSQFPIYIALNFGEPSIKPTQVEPEAGAIIASCDGAVNGTEK